MATQYEGRYWVKVLSQALGKASTGNPQFVLSFEVVGKVDMSDPDGELLPCPRNERRIYFVITDKSVDYVIEDLKRLGFTKTSFRFLDPSTEGYHDFTGHEFAAYCTVGEYQGKAQEKWRISGDGFKVEPLDPKKVRDLDNLYDKKLKAAFPAAAPKRSASAAPPATEAELAGAKSDDIPF